MIFHEEHLDLHHNLLDSTLPTEIGNIRSLQYIDISVNSVSGQLPTEIGVLTLCTLFSVHTNVLTGSIPKHIGLMTSLITMDLSANKLSGVVPWEFSQLTKIEYLNLGSGGNAQLYGSLVEFCESIVVSDITYIGVYMHDISHTQLIDCPCCSLENA